MKNTFGDPKKKFFLFSKRYHFITSGDETVKTFDRFNGQFLFKFKIGTNDQDKRGPISNHAESSRESITYNDDDCGCPWSIHWTMDETLLVGDIRHDFVYIVDKRGQKLGCFGGSGWGPNRFNGPVAICSDGDGNVAIADSKVRVLRRKS